MVYAALECLTASYMLRDGIIAISAICEITAAAAAAEHPRAYVSVERQLTS